MSAHSSRSDANNSKASFEQASWGRSCNCGRPTIKLKSWTDENPGRIFYKCDVHGFVSWVDVEKQCNWQKLSLLEARDEIRHYKQKVNVLKDSVIEEKKIIQLEEGKKQLEKEKKQLEDEVNVAKEREKLLRQFIAISWGGFILAIAIIITILK
ncbi:PREDICTED: uncharacterized protein LOC104772956 [Camelina sativa]|uniref:Uncharacterized protein LOC104772956 n=1 Tax=Camelina sativa TaxID=90675 RepID=A0ABM0Y5E0_CAMSA|nr:PREDICTED: uncharacterized protein LOC104772956 [Camelina sativa]